MTPAPPSHDNLHFNLTEAADPATRERIHGEIKAFNDAASLITGRRAPLDLVRLTCW